MIYVEIACFVVRLVMFLSVIYLKWLVPLNGFEEIHEYNMLGLGKT